MRHPAAAAGILVALVFGAAASARETPTFFERDYETAEKLHELYEQLEDAGTLFKLDSIDDAIVGGLCREEHLFYSEALAEVRKLAARKRAHESLTYDEERYYEDQQLAEERLWKEFEDCYTEKLRLPTFQNELAPGIDTYLDAVATYDWLRAEHGWQQDAGFDLVAAEIEREIEKLESEPPHIGTVVSVFREAWIIRRGGQPQPLGPGKELMLRDIIRTGPRSRVRIEFADRNEKESVGPTVVNIGSSSEVSLDRFSFRFEEERSFKDHLVHSLRGAIRVFTTGWGATAAFSVRVGVSLCGIRGTDIEIDYVPELDEVKFRLHEGVVEITTPGGKVILEPGEELTVRDGLPVRSAPPS